MFESSHEMNELRIQQLEEGRDLGLSDDIPDLVVSIDRIRRGGGQRR
jgi:hypothetical protein